jgi:hypothetical protein
VVVRVQHDNDRGRPGEEAAPDVENTSTTSVTDIGPLRRLLEKVAAEDGVPLKDLTVLASQNDPFRVDTPARHRDGEWLAITARDLGLGSRKIHLRGLHYMVIGRPKPDGTPYTNTEADWLWLSSDAGKAARWLGYIEFDQIVDQRNAAPVVRIFEAPGDPWPYLHVGIRVEIPDYLDLEPRINLLDFTGTQPYKLVMVGEKSSLDDVLAPIAASRQADLYLPTGEPSDTLLYQMARIGAEDGRPMVVLYFSDADPSGWQMPISVGRKLQGLKEGWFPELDFEVRRVALTPGQVGEYGLPSTPLKETEKRAGKWFEAFGVEQTEIDALASLQPDPLRRIAREAITPFYDTALAGRVQAARSQWLDEAQTVVDESTDAEQMESLRAEATEKLSELRAEIDAINDALRIDAGQFDLPPVPAVPEATLYGSDGLPLLDSRWSFTEQCRALIDSKAYRENGHAS